LPYKSQGQLSHETEASDVAFNILKEIHSGLKVAKYLTHGSNTERWSTAEAIGLNVLNPAEQFTQQGVMYGVEAAVSDETEYCADETPVVDSSSGTITRIKKGEHPYTWEVQVSVDENGDPRPSYNVTKGWTKRGCSTLYTVDPSIHAITYKDTSKDAEKYGWNGLWTSRGRRKTEAELSKTATLDELYAQSSNRLQVDIDGDGYSSFEIDREDWTDGRSDAGATSADANEK